MTSFSTNCGRSGARVSWRRRQWRIGETLNGIDRGLRLARACARTSGCCDDVERRHERHRGDLRYQDAVGVAGAADRREWRVVLVCARVLERLAFGAPALAVLHAAQAVVLGRAPERDHERSHRGSKPHRRDQCEEHCKPCERERAEPLHAFRLAPNHRRGKLSTARPRPSRTPRSCARRRPGSLCKPGACRRASRTRPDNHDRTRSRASRTTACAATPSQRAWQAPP